MAKQRDDQGAQSANSTRKAFAVLDAMRTAVREDHRPRFAECDLPQLGACRIARYQPEVLFVLRQELAQLGVTSPDQLVGLDADDAASQRLRRQCLRLIQRALVPLDHTVLLFPGDDGLQRLSLLLPTPAIASTAAQICQINEFWPTQ